MIRWLYWPTAAQADVNTVSLLHFDLDENSVQQLGTGTVSGSVWYDEYMGSQITLLEDLVPDPIPASASCMRIRFTSGALLGQTFAISSVYEGYTDPEMPEWNEPDIITVTGDASTAVSGDTFAIEQIVAWDSKRETGYTFSGSLQADIKKFGTEAWNGTGVVNGGVISMPLGALGSTWTVEAWVYPTNASNGPILWRQFEWIVEGVSYNEISMWVDPLGCGLGAILNNSVVAAINWPGIQLNQWSHVAIVCDGSTIKFYYNGVLQTPSSTPTPYTGTVFDVDCNASIGVGGQIGSIPNPSYVDEWRLSNIARYTEDFTPPTGPFEV
jgi:hypothetical protein